MQRQFIWLGFIGFVLLVAVVSILFNTPQPPPTSQPPSIVACSALTVLNPTANQQVSSSFTVEAVVNNMNPECRWTVFEAQAGSVEVLDENQNVVGTAALSTQEDWMTDQPVTYSATIEFIKQPIGKNLTLKIVEENPSGEGTPEMLAIPLSYELK